MKCEFCQKIGSRLSVNYNREQVPPDEFAKFKTLLDKGFYRSILQCPKCQTIFYRVREVDNEINYGSDFDEFTEISPERAKELIAILST